jgi:hypothetical protein
MHTDPSNNKRKRGRRRRSAAEAGGGIPGIGDRDDATGGDDDDDDAAMGHVDSHFRKLSGINAVVSEACRCASMGVPAPMLPPSTARMMGGALWGEWMWGCDPGQECRPEILLNRCHLLGLAIARHRATLAPQETR